MYNFGLSECKRVKELNILLSRLLTEARDRYMYITFPVAVLGHISFAG